MNYNEYYEQKRAEVAGKYESAVAEGDMNKAYDILGDLMRFQFISANDSRLSKTSLKEFEKAGIDKDHRFQKDYRKDEDFIPDNLFHKIPVCETVELTSEGHWGKRVELVYEGDIIIPENKYIFSIMGKTSSLPIRGALSGFIGLYKKESGADIKLKWKEALNIGKSRMYEVALGNGQQFAINSLGFVYASTAGNKVSLTLLLSNTDMLKTHINIKRAYESIADVLTGAFIDCGIKRENIQVKFMCDLKKAREKQTLAYSKQPPLSFDRFCEIENKKIAEAAELKETAAENYSAFIE